MSGDQFADRYFPARYFPERYFQGGAVDANAMSASLSATSALVGTLTFTDAGAVVVEAPTGTGGGGAGHWYRGKYRGELRRAIRHALGDLRQATNRRRRKRVARRVAEKIRPSFDFWPAFPAAVRVELAPLEAIRIQLVRVSYELKAAQDRIRDARKDVELADSLERLLAEYETRAKKIEMQEEEAMAMLILLAA